MRIPPGMLDEYMKHVMKYTTQIKEGDTGTLQFDWYVSADKTGVEILEVYASYKAALEHQEHHRELQDMIFRKFGKPYSLKIYGDLSPEEVENVKSGGLDVKIFSLLLGLSYD